MINLDEITRQLAVNAVAIHALLETISDEQARWQPDPQSWCLQQVMEHLYNEERLDFRLHLKEMFSRPPQTWGTLHGEGYLRIPDCREALASFLTERTASIFWLRDLTAPDWDATTEAHFEPSGETMVFSAGDILLAWAAHDYLHLRQINELLYAWHVRQASANAVQYAGGW